MNEWSGLRNKGSSESTYNPLQISWDSSDIFCPLNVSVCELASQKLNIQHWEELKGAQLFVRMWLLHRVFQFNVTRIVG